MRHVALEIPLRLFSFGRNTQSHHTADSWVETLGDPLDRAALACCVTAFEQNHNPQLLVSNPLLQLDQFDLQSSQLFLVMTIAADEGGLLRRRGVAMVPVPNLFFSHNALAHSAANPQGFLRNPLELLIGRKKDFD